MLGVAISMRRLPTRLLLALLGVAVFGRMPLRAATVASSGDASIAHDESAGTWTLTAGGTSLKLALDAGRDFSIVSLTTGSGIAWTSSAAPDTWVRTGNQSLPFGNRAAGFSFQNVSVETHGNRLQLNATFELASAGLRMTRHYAMVAGSPAFEAWTTYTPATHAESLSDLSALQITITAGQVHWVNGLQGSAADVRNDAAFTRQRKTLANGEALALGAEGRSSEQTVPWFAVDGAEDEFFAALMWSGAWSLGITRGRTGLEVSFGLAPMTIAPVKEVVDLIIQHNKDEWRKLNAADLEHQTDLVKEWEIVFEIVAAHGGPRYTFADKYACGSWGQDFDADGELFRWSFHQDHYRALKYRVCDWVVYDSSCYSGLTPQAIDGLENANHDRCTAEPTVNCNAHAGYEGDLATGTAPSTDTCIGGHTFEHFDSLYGALNMPIDKSSPYGGSVLDNLADVLGATPPTPRPTCWPTGHSFIRAG